MSTCITELSTSQHALAKYEKEINDPHLIVGDENVCNQLIRLLDQLIANNVDVSSYEVLSWTTDQL